jgi:hypothetical protein
VVDVTYYRSSDGSLNADDVEYVELDAAGAVSAVSDSSLTLTDQDTGQPDTFIGDPDLGLFDGVNPGDQVDLIYHQSATGDVADAVDDQVWDDLVRGLWASPTAVHSRPAGVLTLVWRASAARAGCRWSPEDIHALCLHRAPAHL